VNRYFRLSKRGTTVIREVRGGVATFFAPSSKPST
jgi:xanthine/uracil/vitamin C permease (AzgA family)